MTAETDSIVTHKTKRIIESLACMLAGILILAGCAARGQLKHAEAGMAGGDGERLALAVAQSRAQFPELSALQLRQGPLLTEQQAGREEPSLALKGMGVGIAPGVQSGIRDEIELALYIDKSRYDAGYMEVAFDGGHAEIWRIIAHDLRGDVAGDFELILTLADGLARVRYLVILGGRYPARKPEYTAYEGTLILPGQGADIAAWERIYKIDFGFRHPLPPAFSAMVDDAQRRTETLKRTIRELEKRKDYIDRARSEMETLAAEPPPELYPELQTLELARRDDEIADMEYGLTEAAAAAEAEFVDYYRLRAEISDHYAEFTDSNLYHWQNPVRRQAYYDHWKKVEFHHPEIDNIHEALVIYLHDPTNLDQTRAEAFTIIDRNNNWDKNPARQIEERTAEVELVE